MKYSISYVLLALCHCPLPNQLGGAAHAAVVVIYLLLGIFYWVEGSKHSPDER